MSAATGALVVGLAGPALAHEHPTPVDLQSPAVVRVNTYAEVRISLIEHDRVGAHVGLEQATYRVPTTSGSGFLVDPSGVVVTSPEAVQIDAERAETYAVNQLFNKVYGDAAPLPDDPYTRQTVPDSEPAARIPERLRACYDTNRTDASGGCVVFTDRVVQVEPFVDSQERHGNLRAEIVQSAPAGTTDSANDGANAEQVTVLKVGGGSMPTIELAESPAGMSAFSALGFVDTPAGAESLRALNGHLAEPGSSRIEQDDVYAELLAGVQDGMTGGPVVGERGEVVGFLSSTGAAESNAARGLTLVGADKIQQALAASGFRPRRGPTDAVYENAMHNYNNQLFGPAIPFLEHASRLYPGHALATEALGDSRERSGDGTAPAAASGVGPGATGGDETSFALLWWTLGVGGAVLAVALAAFFLQSRRSRRAPAAEEPAEAPFSLTPAANDPGDNSSGEAADPPTVRLPAARDRTTDAPRGRTRGAP